jgi:DNA-binding transcriptional regulator YiaG
MGKVETVLKDEIARLSRREARRLMTKPVEDLRRLRRRVAELEGEVCAMKAARAEEQVKTKIRAATETVAGGLATTIRMTPRLIRSLRSRLVISQAELARLVGVSTVAVGQWESGRSRPRPETKARIAALRSVGRREVRRLLTEPGS